MSGILAWMGRPDVVLAVSITAIVISLVAIALQLRRER